VNGRPGSGPVRTLARRALRARPIGDAVRTVAGLGERALVLVYHRVVAHAPSASAIVPTVASDVLRRHVAALADVGEIVPLESLVGGIGRHARPRFALTFDDDYLSHVEHALPILRSLGAPATFFLSGRALHGLGPYWFEVLEREIDARGLAAVTRELGIDADSPEGLALACERDRSLQARLEDRAGEPGPRLQHPDIEALAAAAEMSIGFHTLRHRILPPLPPDELEADLVEGREDLETVVGRRIKLFAYPHGKADPRTAAAVRRADYRAAFTGRPSPVVRGVDPYLLGRWEPGGLGVDDLLVSTAIRLTRGAAR
jgi:peptidoglycan/xylan/chitin deacetylase (PgdA/CDA1 family)